MISTTHFQGVERTGESAGEKVNAMIIVEAISIFID